MQRKIDDIVAELRSTHRVAGVGAAARPSPKLPSREVLAGMVEGLSAAFVP